MARIPTASDLMLRKHTVAGQHRCQLVAFGVNSATADIIEQVKIQSRSSFELTLAVGLLKGDKFDLVVQKTTELGVNRLIPLTTHHADVKIRSDDEAEKKLGMVPTEKDKEELKSWMPKVTMVDRDGKA